MGPYALVPKESLWALLPLLVYIIVAFKPKVHALTSSFLACLVGYILTGQTPALTAKLIQKSLGSTLGLIGLIIMCGAGLGAVMSEAHVTHTLVHWIVKYIGVKTEKRAILCVIITTTLVCGLLGTLAGGCAIIAPILIPVVAAAGLKPATVACLFQSSGETGLIWGPFTGPTVALLAITGLSYGRMMLWAAIPYGLIWLAVIYWCGTRIQKDPSYDEVYVLSEDEKQTAEVSSGEKRTTVIFILGFLGLLAYSMMTHQGTAYTVFVMLTLAVVIAVFSRMSLSTMFKAFSQGMGKMSGTFLLFIFLNMMLEYINLGHGFEALGKWFLQFVGEGSRATVVILGTLVGSFGINGGAVAQLQVTNDLFIEAVKATQVPEEVWALALICGSRVTTSIYPGSNMIAPMGLARSESIKAMLFGGWCVSMVSIVFIVIWAIVGMPIFFPV
ncbi:MAG: TRAP transporter large permease subunit [Acidaminococcus provencensis]|jgi:H+/gluconate symporter-like permease|uniref:GntT/GntP/DsdX family permease n=1 Tax=Acidaminococcus provencensis TaxID=2058289 RepID=UPI0023F1A2F7|nr:TRAP transporter large permease subunit [Acidaminococcus provencensis]MCH4096680.1 TRAP transporter large permease subunit [Acidaminococcus provencensis]